MSGFFQLAGAFAAHVPVQLRVLGLVSGALGVRTHPRATPAGWNAVGPYQPVPACRREWAAGRYRAVSGLVGLGRDQSDEAVRLAVGTGGEPDVVDPAAGRGSGQQRPEPVDHDRLALFVL